MAKQNIHCKLAKTPTEIRAYFQLRREIFCVEQQIFTNDDRDDTDSHAYPIVAIARDPSPASSSAEDAERVVGVVRIYETKPGYWYGGRLGVHRDYRRRGLIGKQLIQKAVTTANTWGCEQFLATVQLQNVRFFQRLHWASLEEITICDRPHHLMEADLNYYPPTTEVRPAMPPLLASSLVVS